MAAATDATNPPEVKVCAHCGEEYRRRGKAALSRWSGRRYCSAQCGNLGKIKAGPPRDLVGGRFGRWTVLSYAGRDYRNKHSWNSVCDCGAIGKPEDSALKAGNSQSCGCAQREAVARAGMNSSTHGMSKNGREYTVWKSMKQRCFNPNVKNFSDYGGRGITVCDRWRDSFEAFFEDMGPRPSSDHSIDRIDNDGNYEPNNCRWSTFGEQVKNRRSNLRVIYNGTEMVLAEAAKLAGVKYSTAKARYHKGWSHERVLAI